MSSIDKAMKEAIAAEVLGALGGLSFGSVGKHTAFGVIDVEVHPVSKLQAQLRVKTHNNGTHYYNITVSEQW